MAIWTAIQPPQFVWSRQPITYVISYNSITAGNSIQVQIIDTQSNMPLGEGVRYTATATSGTLTLDLAPLIDPYLSYADIAGIGTAAGEQVVEVEASMSKKVHLRFREYSLASPNQSWTDEWNKTFTVVKGGVGEMTFADERYNQISWFGHLFFPNTDGAAHPWMSYRGVTGNIIHAKEWRWLLYMHIGQDEPRVKYTIYFADGSQSVLYRYMSNRNVPYNGRLIHIPIGLEQASLNPLNKKVARYTVAVEEMINNGVIKAFMEFDVDNRPVYNPMTLLFRNSVGGIESLFLRGAREIAGASFTKQLSERNRWGGAQSGPVKHFYSEGTLKFAGHTGYLADKDLAVLWDLFNCTEMCGVISAQPYSPRKFYPMRVPPQDMPVIDRDAHLKSYKIEFESAGSFRNMPRNIFNFLR